MTQRYWLRGDWFVSSTGRALTVNPRPEDIDLRDIAHHLALVCRYGGASPSHYSVASHSLMVCDMLEPLGREAMIEGLLHDASEAYTGDLIKPIKVHCPDFATIEHRFERAIRERFSLPRACPIEASVKAADIAALLCERRDVFGDTNEYADRVATGDIDLDVHVCGVDVPWRDVERWFLAKAAELGLK